MHPLLDGILFGLLLALMVGPVFFALMHRALDGGFFPAMFMALGVVTSDAFFVVLCHVGISRFYHLPAFEMVLGMIGGIILLVFGLRMIFIPLGAGRPGPTDPGQPKWLKNVVKGFLINSLNPFVLFFWLGVASLTAVKYQAEMRESTLFYGAALATVLLTDVLKVYLAHRLSSLVNSHFIRRLNRIAGFALVLYAIRLLFYAFRHSGGIF